jgi:NAD+--asparagine ADP-ribosyltransferase
MGNRAWDTRGFSLLHEAKQRVVESGELRVESEEKSRKKVRR